MMPRWQRPYAPWETAILRRRLEQTTARVRPEFPGRDVAYLMLSPEVGTGVDALDSGPPGPPGTTREALQSAHVDRRAGMAIVWGSSDGVDAWRALLGGAESSPAPTGAGLTLP